MTAPDRAVRAELAESLGRGPDDRARDAALLATRAAEQAVSGDPSPALEQVAGALGAMEKATAQIAAHLQAQAGLAAELAQFTSIVASLARSLARSPSPADRAHRGPTP